MRPRRSIGAVIARRSSSSASSTPSSTSASAQAEVGSEIELAPNRKPYLRRRGARGPQARPHAHARACSACSSSAIGLPLYWLTEPGRQAGADRDFDAGPVRQPRRGAVRPHRRGRLQLRRLPRRQDGGGGAAPYTLTDADGRVRQPGRRGRRRRSTPCCCASAATRSATSSPTAGRSRRCRRGASTAAARSTTSRSRTSSTTSRSIQLTPEGVAEAGRDGQRTLARRAAQGLRRTSDGALDSDTDVRQSAEGEALFNLGLRRRLRRRRLLLRPLPHQGLVLRARRRSTANGALGPAAARDVTAPSSPGASLGPRQPDSTSSATAREHGMLYGQHGQGTGRMPGFCVTPERRRTIPATTGEVGVDAAGPGAPPTRSAACCTQDARPARSSSTSGASDAVSSRPRLPSPGTPASAGILTVVGRRHRPDGLGLPARSPPTSAPASASCSPSPASSAGCSLMGIIWCDLRHRLQGPGAALEGRARSTSATVSARPTPRSRRSLPEPDELPDPVEVLDDSDALPKAFPTDKRDPDARRPRHGATRSSPSELNGADRRVAPAADVEQGRPVRPSAAVAEDLGPGRAATSSPRPADYVDPRRRSATGGKPKRDRRRHRSGASGGRSATSSGLKHPPRYAVVQVQPVVPQETEPGQAPPTPGAPTRRSRSSSVIIEPRPRRPAPPARSCSRSSPGIMFARALRHAPPPRQARRRPARGRCREPS